MVKHWLFCMLLCFARNVLALDGHILDTLQHNEQYATRGLLKDEQEQEVLTDLISLFLKLNARVQLLFDECVQVENEAAAWTNYKQNEQLCSKKNHYTMLIHAYEQCAESVIAYKNLMLTNATAESRAVIKHVHDLENHFEQVLSKRLRLQDRLKAFVDTVVPEQNCLLRNTLELTFEELIQCCTHISQALCSYQKTEHNFFEEQKHACAKQFKSIAEAFASLKEELQEYEHKHKNVVCASTSALSSATESYMTKASSLWKEWKDRVKQKADLALHRSISVCNENSQKLDQECRNVECVFNNAEQECLDAHDDAKEQLADLYTQAKKKCVQAVMTWEKAVADNISMLRNKNEHTFEAHFDGLEHYYKRANQEFLYHMDKLAERVGDKFDDRVIQVGSLVRAYKYKFFDELAEYVHSVAGQISTLSSEYAERSSALEALITRINAYISVELCKQVDEMNGLFKEDTQNLLTSFHHDVEQLTVLIDNLINELHLYENIQQEQLSAFAGLDAKMQDWQGTTDCSGLIIECQNLVISKERLINAVHDEFIIILASVSRLYAAMQQQVSDNAVDVIQALEVQLNKLSCMYKDSHARLCEKISNLTKAFITELQVRMAQVIANAQSVVNFAPGIEENLREVAFTGGLGVAAVETVTLAWIINNDIEATVLLACVCFRLAIPGP